MNRSKAVAVCVFIFLFTCFSLEAWAGPLVWGPKKYVRETGKPVSVLDIFAIEKPTGKFYMTVINGGSVKKPELGLGVVESVDQVSSAYIKLNGVEVVSPNDFNQEVSWFNKDDITILPNNTIEVEVRGTPWSYITVEIRKESSNPQVSNKEVDLRGENMKTQTVLWWSDAKGASEYIIYKAYSKDGPWIEWERGHYAGEPTNTVDITPEAQTSDLCYKIEAIDSRGRVIRRYEPICVPKWQKEEVSLPLTQRKKPNTCVSIAKGKDLGNLFLTGRGNPSLPFVQLASLSMPIGIQLASATSPQSSSQSSSQYNSMCLSDEEFTDTTTMNYEDIKKLLKDNKSFLNGKIKDVDGVEIDPADAINLAALLLGINPQVLLTTLQKERCDIKAKTRLADDELKTIMGYDTANPTTIREQIYDAAGQMRRDFDRLTNGQSTAGGWGKGVAKNSLDPLTVTPANKAVAILFSYTPWVGKEWGGRKGGNALFCQLWEQFEFGIKCRPGDVLTITGSGTTTRNSTKQYTAARCSNVTWRVSGKDATISSAGVLTTGSTACGSLTITANCSQCGISATKKVRVTDAGKWDTYAYASCGYYGPIAREDYPPICSYNPYSPFGYICYEKHSLIFDDERWVQWFKHFSLPSGQFWCNACSRLEGLELESSCCGDGMPCASCPIYQYGCWEDLHIPQAWMKFKWVCP